MTNNKTISFYFHIPFCVRKCNYCDFLSAPATEETKNAYMQAMYSELEERGEEYGTYLVTSIFFGGGTPSVADPVWIEKILNYVKTHFPIYEKIEITMEVNPGTVNEEKLRRYKEAGVNRLSIGMQSANNDLLKILGRIHTFEQFKETYELATKCGFDNVNVDIMGALPKQSMEDYRTTIGKVVGLNPAPKHISLYSLILEENTVFYDWYEAGKMRQKGDSEDSEEAGAILLPDEDMERAMYAEGNRLLKEAGYIHYEISNYAKEGYECRHNCGYWTRANYLGFGIGAASMVENVRFSNTPDLMTYLNCPTMAVEERTVLGKKEQMEEFMFLGLRMMEGVSRQKFFDTFGTSMDEVYGKVISKFMEEGLLEERTDRLVLTDKGIDLDNYVSAGFLL